MDLQWRGKYACASALLQLILTSAFFASHVNSFELSFGGPTQGPNVSSTYDPNFRPNHGAVADMLSLSLDSLSIRRVDPLGSKFTADLTLRTSWTDPRLKYAVNRSTTFVTKLPTVWFPPLFIMDASDETVAASMVLKPEGEIVLSERHIAEVNCEFYYMKLPFDVQDCGIRFKTHAFSTLHLDMVWNGRLDETHVKVYDAEFKLSAISQASDKEREVGGEFRVLRAGVKLSRNPFKYFKSIMLPGIVLTLLAYSTLFVRDEAANGMSPFQFGCIRFALSTTVFLVYAILTQIYYASADGGSVLTGVDVWIWLASALQLFLAFFNFALLVGYKSCQEAAEEKSKPCLQRLGKLLKLGIPTGAVLFLIIYFIVYLI